MVIAIQIVGLAFSLFMIYLFFVQYKKKELTRKEFILWMFFWLIFILLTLYPPALDPILGTLKFNRALDFFTVIGVLILVFLTMHNYILVKKMNKRTENLVRNIALNKK